VTDHSIVDVEVVVSCSCGKACHAETEAYAIEEWDAHVRDATAEPDDHPARIAWDSHAFARQHRGGFPRENDEPERG
jgi:hypothetical protein